MSATTGTPRLGVVILEFDGAVETLDMPDPFNVPASLGMTKGLLQHRDFWPIPTAFAVARGAAGGQTILDGESPAVAGIADAVDRLAPHCDLILGGAGYMYTARNAVRSNKPTVLSGLQFLPNALAASPSPVGVLTFNAADTADILADQPGFDRMRFVEIGSLPSWSTFKRPDALLSKPVSTSLLRDELVELCEKERRSGVFKDIGSLVIECTGTCQFRGDLITALKMPVWDIAAFALAMLKP